MERGGLRPRRALETYLSNYRDKHDGSHDLLWAFRLIAENFGCRSVMYPGSHLHITPSLVFPEVCYVDSVKGISSAMADRALLQYVAAHKDYPERTSIRCCEEDYRSFANEQAGSFDLLISLNAGFISRHCARFLRPGGYLLANNGHYDANCAFVDSRYRLVAVLEDGALTPDTSQPGFSPYFTNGKGEALTLAMVESDVGRPPSKARFRPLREAEAYLFSLVPAG